MTIAKSWWPRGLKMIELPQSAVGLERSEFTPVEHALVDDRIPLGYLKSPSCAEAGSSTLYRVE